jgi:hypothetical protein
MRRYRVLLIASIVALMGIGVLAPGDQHSAAHQLAQQGGSTGVTTEELGAQGSHFNAGQMLHMLRVTFAPGGSVDSHMHPGSTIYHLEQGQLVFTLLQGEASLVRAGQGEDSRAERIALNEAITLSAGDTVFYYGSAVQIERNDGEVDAVVLISNLREWDEPARVYVETASQPRGGLPTP